MAEGPGQDLGTTFTVLLSARAAAPAAAGSPGPERIGGEATLD